MRLDDDLRPSSRWAVLQQQITHDVHSNPYCTRHHWFGSDEIFVSSGTVPVALAHPRRHVCSLLSWDMEPHEASPPCATSTNTLQSCNMKTARQLLASCDECTCGLGGFSKKHLHLCVSFLNPARTPSRLCSREPRRWRSRPSLSSCLQMPTLAPCGKRREALR